MVILALDTTTREGSVAVRRSGQLLVSRSGDPMRTHGERLPSELLAALDEADVTLVEVDLFAVASGPGSFTGLRVGMATVQGLALSQQRLVNGIPTLDAIAHAGLWSLSDDQERPALVVPWMNAHRGEVFSAVYEVRDADHLVERRLASVGSPERLVHDWDVAEGGQKSLVIGDAVESTRRLLEGRLAHARLVAEMPSLAPAVARLADEAGVTGAIRPHAVRPVYVRRPDAELARERQQHRQ